MTFRVVFVALWAFWLSQSIYTERPWKPFWIVLESVMLVGSIVWAVGAHSREVEQARKVQVWRRR